MTNILNWNSALALVQSNQAAYSGHQSRGTRALAALIGDAYTDIQRIRSELPVADQSVILDRHQVRPASAGTSAFTPWIKVFFGAVDPKAKKVKGLDGAEYPKWTPNRSFEVYHHTMEELAAAAVTTDVAGYIIAHGGAQAMADARKKRLADADEAVSNPAAEEKRALLVQECGHELLGTDIELPKDTGEFFTLLCRKDDGRIVHLGVAKKDALAEANRVAAAMFEQLSQQRADRAAERSKEEAIQRAREEGARFAIENSKLLMHGITPDRLRELMHTATVKANSQDVSSDEQVEG